MGPYSVEIQQQRAERIASMLLDNKISPEVKRIWEAHLANMARNETDYNARVISLYGEKKWNQYIGMLLHTS